MYLTNAEHEAFMRGQAAGLIPVDIPLPTTEKEIDELIFHVGIFFNMKFAYRRPDKTLRIMEVSVFTEEHLKRVIANLPILKKEEVLFMTSFRKETYPNPLESLCNYFSFGPGILSETDLAGRLSAYNRVFSVDQVRKGFELNYVPVIRTGLATLEQKAVLTEMVLNNDLPAISRRQWENMTMEEAAKLIVSAPKPRARLPVNVALAMNAIDRLSGKERFLLSKILNQQRSNAA